MFLELISTFILAIAVAGAIMLVNKTIGGRLPRWFMPAGAGLGMIIFTIWNEYNWYPHSLGNLPEGVEVATTVESTAFYRPWTYIAPYVSRFAAVDRAGTLKNESAPNYRMAPVIFMGRWSPVNKVRMLFDCEGNRRIDIVEGVELGSNGLPVEGSPWLKLEADNPLLMTACKE